jgi:putative endonuclease
MYTVYIIYSASLDKYYIGFTTDVNGRLRRHNCHSKGFTSSGRPWILVYSETFTERKEAESREKQLKKWKNRARLEALIKKGSEHPDTLVSGGS